MEHDHEPLETSLRNVIEKKSLRWIFVGGKGGVGKTTCSCCLATQLAKVRDSVLLISTDPAHNISDAFGQKFTKNPTKVSGFENLFAMEIDPTMEQEDLDAISGLNQEKIPFQDLAFAIPGIDEAMSFAEVMRQVQSMEFSVIIFDTAPTGHTLRLLSFPAALEKGLGQIIQLKSKFSGLLSQITSLLSPGGGESEESFTSKLEVTKKVIEEIHKQFTNPELTTFICVCIPEFLSLYETERLIQELANFHMHTNNIIVNQILYPQNGDNCGLCTARFKMQRKYLEQIDDLYKYNIVVMENGEKEDLRFHVTELPLLEEEIRGVQLISEFSKNLIEPYKH